MGKQKQNNRHRKITTNITRRIKIQNYEELQEKGESLLKFRENGTHSRYFISAIYYLFYIVSIDLWLRFSRFMFAF